MNPERYCCGCHRTVPAASLAPLVTCLLTTIAHVAQDGSEYEGSMDYTTEDERQEYLDSDDLWDLGPDPDPEPLTDFANRCGAV